MTRRALFLLSIAAAACASGPPVETEFDYSAGLVTVELLGDGFVRVDERRIPLEALVLELRRATRAMERSELLRYVVRIRLAKVKGGEAARVQQMARARLLDQLEIMGVRQVVYL
ncbi:MAG: hypothetical protein KAI24_01105 [Planctomycetes bacterium]|nr:hypothetical protein [Planctomycetota bacterium]